MVPRLDLRRRPPSRPIRRPGACRSNSEAPGRASSADQAIRPGCGRFMPARAEQREFEKQVPDSLPPPETRARGGHRQSDLHKLAIIEIKHATSAFAVAGIRHRALEREALSTGQVRGP